MDTGYGKYCVTNLYIGTLFLLYVEFSARLWDTYVHHQIPQIYLVSPIS